MYKIRALTLHLDTNRKFNSLDDFIDYLLPYLDKLDNLASEFSKEKKVLSKRLVFPSFEKLWKHIENFNMSKVTDIENYVEKYVDFFNIPIIGWRTRIDYLNELPSIFAETRNFYTSLRIDKPPLFPNHYRQIVNLLKKISEVGGWDAATRFAFSFGPQPLTPYFPVAKSSGIGFSISLLYINDLIENLSDSYDYKALEERIEEIENEITTLSIRLARKFKLSFLGVDLSLSPWLEESIVPLIEYFKENLTMGTVGSLNVIYEINKVLRKLAKRPQVIGFNEIMLPLAEDEGLKRRVRENDLSFKDFIAFCFVCTAGLDMIPIPEWTDIQVLLNLFYDLRAAYKIKKRTVGVRLIPVGAEPGEEIELREFGNTPVLDVLK